MSIEAIAAVGSLSDSLAQPMAVARPTEPASWFAWAADQVSAADQDVHSADAAVRRLAAGEGEDLHRVMLQLEKAKLSLSLTVQVRNRLLESYQEVMRMQI